MKEKRREEGRVRGNCHSGLEGEKGRQNEKEMKRKDSTALLRNS